MKRVIRSKPMVLVLISMLFTSLFTVIGPNETSANSTTYYIDSVDGDDNNSGTSSASAWRSLDKVNSTTFQPGDSILFKAGGVWTGTLHPLGLGTPEQMIKIGMYDTGALPRIQGAGAARAVYLYNQEYWDIGFLEVTNYGSSSDTAPRVGVQVVGEDYQVGTATDIENVAVLHNIRIHDLYVHDVNGQDTGESAGIRVHIEIGSGPVIRATKFDGVYIENNVVENVQRTGITTSSAWRNRELLQGSGFDASKPWIPLTNVVIRGNQLKNIGGDGITPHTSDGALVERNRLDGYNKTSAGYNAGLWTYNGDNTIYQYNEVSGGYSTRDGMPFDFDHGSRGIIYQYNYSHDNDGGTLLICGDADLPGGGTFDGIFRYNISQNDKYQTFSICRGNNVKNIQIYNNVFYIRSGLNTKPLVSQGGSTEVKLSNNIFYNLGSGGYTAKSGWTYDHNLFYGNKVPSVSTIPDAAMITANPLFVNPGQATGIGDLDGYRLQSQSPAINSGATIVNNGGLDFAGEVVPYNGSPTDRGAFEYQGEVPWNLSLGKSLTSSTTISNPGYATDGSSQDSNQFAGLNEPGLQWAQLDLEQSYQIERLKTWHYFGNNRKYHDVIIQLSDTPDFSSGVTTVFNNDTDNSAGQGAGTDQEYTETSAGLEVSLPTPVQARYVRYWSSGSTANAYTHYVELEVYGL